MEVVLNVVKMQKYEFPVEMVSRREVGTLTI
jgi:hypothetical protein